MMPRMGQQMQFNQLKRREFITLLGSAAAWPLAAHAQYPTGKLPRVGSIQTFPNENTEAFEQGLRESGYLDGRNVLLELIASGCFPAIVSPVTRSRNRQLCVRILSLKKSRRLDRQLLPVAIAARRAVNRDLVAGAGGLHFRRFSSGAISQTKRAPSKRDKDYIGRKAPVTASRLF
jgi:hypothetical protein